MGEFGVFQTVENRSDLFSTVSSAGMEIHRIAERLSLGKSMAYRILGDMKKRGLVVQEGHGGVWCLPNSGK